MDISQITSLSTSLSNQQVNSAVGDLMLKKTLNIQKATAANILQALPQLPSNPAIGRNINVIV